jgi:hypothetical protein
MTAPVNPTRTATALVAPPIKSFPVLDVLYRQTLIPASKHGSLPFFTSRPVHKLSLSHNFHLFNADAKKQDVGGVNINGEQQGRQEMWVSFLFLSLPSFFFPLVSPLDYLFGSLLLLPPLLTDAGSAFFFISLLSCI